MNGYVISSKIMSVALYEFCKSRLTTGIKFKKLKNSRHGKWSWGRISWDRNSTFSGGQIFDHEIKIQFVHEV